MAIFVAACGAATPPRPQIVNPRASAAEKEAAEHALSHCVRDAASTADRHASTKTLAHAAVPPCHATFEAMLKVEEKGMGPAEATGFDQAMRKQELNIATQEVLAARHASSDRHHAKARHRTTARPVAAPQPSP